MKLYIKEVNPENIEAIKALKVKTDQTKDIETNEESINEALEYTLWRPSGIYDENTLIGFAMFGEWTNEDQTSRVWLDRFMIDEKFQHQGYGKSGIKFICNYLFEHYQCNEIYLSVFESNTHARRLYESLHFKYNGELDYGGELVMVLNEKEAIKSL